MGLAFIPHGSLSGVNLNLEQLAALRTSKTSQPREEIAPVPDAAKVAELRVLIDANPEIGEAGLFVDGDLVEQRIAEFSRMVPGARATFDMAQLDDPAVVEFIAERGIPLSAGSGYHLRLAQVLGVQSEMVRLGTPSMVRDTVAGALETRPPTLSVEDVASVHLWAKNGLFSIPGYQPTLAIHVRSGDQPYHNPLRVDEVISAAKGYGIQNFEIVASVTKAHHEVSSLRNALEAALNAVQVARTRGEVAIQSVHIGGGLLDPRTLVEQGIAPAQYLADIGSAVESFRARARGYGFDRDVSMDIGRWVIGESCIAAKVTGTRVDKGQFQVFIADSRYGGLNRSMYDGESIDVAVIPRGDQKPFPGTLVETVVQGSSCDSVDKLPGTHLLPRTVSAGEDGVEADWIACFSTGHNSVSSGLDFNMIELPGVVISRKRNGTLECAHSPFLRKQEFLLEAARDWNRGGRRSSQIVGALGALTEQSTKFREGTALRDIHVKATLPYLRDAFAHSRNTAEQEFARKGFLLQDGCQVLATIEALLDHVKVDSLCIAQKAQNDPTVIALEQAANVYLEQKGKGAPEGARKRVMMDTASAGEMLLAAANGFPASDMIVSHPHKSEITLEAIRELRPWAWTFDSEQELQRVLQAGAGPVRATRTDPGYEPTVLVRVKASGKGVKNDLSSKFGCDVPTAIALLESAHAKGFTQFGVAFHVGTQCCNARNYADALAQVLDVIRGAKALGINVSVVDIGGGFPDARAVREAKTTQLLLLKQIGDVITEFREATRYLTGSEVFIVAEPGRIITDRGTILSPIIKAYTSSASTIPQLRISEFGRGGLSGATHDEQNFDMRVVPGPARPKGFRFPDTTVLSQVFGATGFDSDQFIHRVRPYAFPTEVEAGDYAAIFCTGSYSSSAGAIVAGHEPSGVILALPNGYWVSPWFSKNDVYLKALRKHIEGQKNQGLDEAA